MANKQINELTELDMDKEQIKKNVSIILKEFLKQEIGNKITSFNIQGLTNIIINTIDNGIQYVDKEE
jgi:hypothetical protein